MGQNNLIVKIGAKLTDFKRGINEANRSLRKFGRQAENIGRSLTTSLTLPIVGVGAAAVKTFAEFDRLEKGLAALSGPEKAKQQFQDLIDIVRDTRTTLDLKGATATVLQLQAVGVEAGKAANLVKQLGIAATVSGAGADDIAGVGIQLAQAAAKGQILQQELRIILERIPALGSVIKNEFGVVTADGLRKAGVSAQQFIDRLTLAIENNEKFQNVQGGLAKAFETFTLELRLAGNELGKVIAESIGLQDVMTGIIEKIQNAVQYFARLDDATKNSIIRFVGFIAAAGPAAFVLGKLANTVVSAIGFFKLFGGVVTNSAGKVYRFAKSLKGLDFASLVTKLGPWTLGLTALAGVLLLLKKRYDRVTKAARTYSAISTETTSKINAEKSAIKPLLAILQDENATRQDKVFAINKLQEIAPDYFSGLKLEGNRVVGLTKAYDSYNKALQLTAEIEAILTQKRLINTEIEELSKKVKEGGSIWRKYAVDVLNALSINAGTSLDLKVTTGQFKELQELQGLLDGLNERSTELQRKLAGVLLGKPTSDGGDIPEPPPPPGKGVDKGLPKDQIVELEDATARLSAIFTEAEEKRTLFADGLKSMPADMEKLNEKIEENKNKFKEWGDAFKFAGDEVGDFRDKFEGAFEAIGEQAGKAFGLLLKGTKEGLDAAKEAFKQLRNVAVDAVADIIQALVKQTIAALIAKAVGTLGPFGLAVAAGAGALVAGVFKSAFSSIPKLATGGVVPPGFPGDTYPAFLSSGETVLPKPLPLGGGPGSGFIAETRIGVKDLIIAIRREENYLSRVE